MITSDRQIFLSILKACLYIGLFALLLTPFIVSNSLYFPYITGKAFFFRIVVEIIFFLWVIIAVLDPEYRPRKSSITAALGFFLVGLFVSNVFGADRVASFWSNFERMDGYITIAHIVALVVVIGSFLRSKREWTVFFHILVASSIVMVVQSFNQIAVQGFNYRIDTTLGNPIYLAVYMLFSAFFSLWLIAQLNKDTVRDYFVSLRFWLYIAAFVLQSIVLFQTQTRGAMLGLIGGLGITTLLAAIFARAEPAIRKISIASLVFVVIFTATIFVFKDSHFIKNIQSFNRLATISASEGTGQARLLNWGIAWEGIKERPILGWGQSNYNFVYDKYFNPQMFGQETWFDRTHNIILDWLIAGGFVGLILYLSIIFCALWVLWKNSTASVFEKSVLTGLLAGYFIHNLFVFDHVVSYLLFAFVLACIYSQSAAEWIWMQGRVSERVTIIVIVAVFIGTPFIIFDLNHSGYVAARDVVAATQLFKRDTDGKIFYYNPNGFDDNIDMYQKIIELNTFGNAEITTRLISSISEVISVTNLPDDVEKHFTDFAIHQFTQQYNEHLNDSRYPYLLAAAYSQLGQYDQALKFINKAIELGPKRQIFYFLRARILIAKGDKIAAIESAKFAYELAPQFDSAWAQYVGVLSASDSKKFQEEIVAQIAARKFERVELVILDSINRNPTVVSSYVSLSALYFQMGETEKSLAVLDDTIVKFPAMKTQLEKLKVQIKNGANPVGKSF